MRTVEEFIKDIQSTRAKRAYVSLEFYLEVKKYFMKDYYIPELLVHQDRECDWVATVMGCELATIGKHIPGFDYSFQDHHISYEPMDLKDHAYDALRYAMQPGPITCSSAYIPEPTPLRFVEERQDYRNRYITCEYCGRHTLVSHETCPSCGALLNFN